VIASAVRSRVVISGRAPTSGRSVRLTRYAPAPGAIALAIGDGNPDRAARTTAIIDLEQAERLARAHCAALRADEGPLPTDRAEAIIEWNPPLASPQARLLAG
jgi:hypothetical protein